MKIFKITLILLGCFLFFSSCEKTKNKDYNFFNLEDRIGLWVSPDKKHSLEFTNSTDLILKGKQWGKQEHLYRISADTLFIISIYPTDTITTVHLILSVKCDRVVLENMFPTLLDLEKRDNSGTFIKK
jgi:hypothetical protein